MTKKSGIWTGKKNTGINHIEYNPVVRFIDVATVFVLGDSVGYPFPPIEITESLTIELSINADASILFVDVDVAVLSAIFVLGYAFIFSPHPLRVKND